MRQVNDSVQQEIVELIVRLSDIEARLVSLTGGQVDVLIGADGDRHLLPNAQADVIRSAAAFQRMFSSAAVGIVRTNAAAQVQDANPAFCHMVGRSEEELLGAEFTSLLDPAHGQGLVDLIAEIRNGKRRDFVIESRLQHLGVDGIWSRFSVSAVHGTDDVMIGFVVITEDISEQRAAEAITERLQAEMAHLSRLNAMGAMASTLAHELNQPLAAVINYISGSLRLLDEAKGPTVLKIRDSMHSAQDCAQQAGETIRHIRNQLSRRDSQQRVVTAGSLVKDACNIALINASELGVNVVVDLDPAVTSVFVDDIQFQQILINLLRNAAEAVSGQAERQIVISTRLANSYVAFAVDDNGPGVAKAMEARLFNPFESSKPDGMGIGLSISRTIAEAHGGRLEYEASVLGGARFTILLPNSAESAHRA